MKPELSAHAVSTTPSAVSAIVSAASVPTSVGQVVVIRRRSSRIRSASPPRAESTPEAPAPATQVSSTSRRRGRSSSGWAAQRIVCQPRPRASCEQRCSTTPATSQRRSTCPRDKHVDGTRAAKGSDPFAPRPLALGRERRVQRGAAPGAGAAREVAVDRVADHVAGDRDGEPGGDVEHEVVAGGDDREADDRRPRERGRLRQRVPEGHRQRDADGECEAGVQARHRGERVVEGLGQRRVEPDAAAVRDRVDHPDVGEPRGRDGEQRVDRHRDQPRRQDGVAQLHVDVVVLAVEPDQRAGDDHDLGGQVQVVEDPDQDRAVERRLHRGLDVHADALLQVDDPLGVAGGGGDVADRDVAGRRVQEVRAEEEEELAASNEAEWPGDHRGNDDPPQGRPAQCSGLYSWGVEIRTREGAPSPVMRRAPRPRVRNEKLQRSRTSSRFWKPIR